MPGYTIYEYMLILSPHEALREKIAEVRKSFEESYHPETTIASKPNLMLCHFSQYEVNEERLLNRLRLIAMGLPSIKVEMKDYGSFPTHSIFINVTSKVPVQTLVKNIRAEAQRLMKLNDENKPLFMLEPTITIARKLKPWQYEKGWLEYSHRQFTGRFIASEMLLLRRPLTGGTYTLAERFPFQNMPVATTQGALF
ncbi:MAG: hypothetical protein EOO03_03605 [Chitinophagaceae bacterium]|nr:MAG: hypothetical protein EOO03_03605 [Chitinophagaceae bacterium]